MFVAYVTEADARAWLAGELTDGALFARPLPLPGEPLALWIVRVDSPLEFRRVHRLARGAGLPVIFTASHSTISRLGNYRATAFNAPRYWMDADVAAKGGRGRKSRAKRPWWRFWA